MPFNVHAEDHDGDTHVLRHGFPTREAAEDHPVKLSLWRRVWVEEAPPGPPRDTAFPPMPWLVEWLNGMTYVRDAKGKRFAILIGTVEKREKVAALLERLITPHEI
jgi:hypothetical protein